MNIVGMPEVEVFTLLLVAMGPVSVTISYLPIAQTLPPQMRRKLACRTVLVAFVVAALLMLLGNGIVRQFHLSQPVLLMGVGVTYIVLAISMLLAQPEDRFVSTSTKEPLQLAISPLAVPGVISPLAVVLLLDVSAFENRLIATLIFSGMVVVVLLIDLGLMLLSTAVAQYLTRSILEVLQKIFGFILLTFGIQSVLQALERLSLIPAMIFSSRC